MYVYIYIYVYNMCTYILYAAFKFIQKYDFKNLKKQLQKKCFEVFTFLNTA